MSLWNLSQNLKIVEAQKDANRANYIADQAKRKAYASMESVERLVLIVRAMWELLHQHTDLTEIDLVNKVRELDLSDGKIDGKFTSDAKPAICPVCGNNVHPSQTRCQFCGAESANQDVFEKV